MSGYDQEAIQAMEGHSILAVSEVMPHVSHLSNRIPGLTDSFSSEDVFAFMLQEMEGKAIKLEDLGKQHSQNRSSLRKSLSSSSYEEYPEILKNKGFCIEKLSDAVEMSDPVGVPKYRLQSYQELSKLLNNRSNEIHQEVQQQNEEMKKIQKESKQIKSHIDVCSNLSVEDIEFKESQETDEVKLLFQEAKADLQTVFQALFSEKEDITEFHSIMGDLTEAYLNNLDNKEDQFVELPSHSLMNIGLCCLMQGEVIVCHPHNPRMFRFSIDE